MQTYYDLYKENDVLIVPDIRFLNEIEFVTKNNGVMLQICRPELLQDNLDHASEQEWRSYKEWDAILMNDSTPEALRKQAGALMVMLANKYGLA